jgi:hypothetical protein
VTAGAPASPGASLRPVSASSDLPLTGRCMCGAVRFEIDRPLVWAGYCHCSRCRRRTGTTAALNAALEPGSLRVVQGEDVVCGWAPPDGWEKLFCGTCGSGLFSRSPDDPERMGVRIGALDSDPGVRPSFRQFVAYAVAWDPIPDDGLPRHAERRPG